jgi:hypothetical protein
VKEIKDLINIIPVFNFRPGMRNLTNISIPQVPRKGWILNRLHSRKGDRNKRDLDRVLSFQFPSLRQERKITLGKACLDLAAKRLTPSAAERKPE